MILALVLFGLSAAAGVPVDEGEQTVEEYRKIPTIRGKMSIITGIPRREEGIVHLIRLIKPKRVVEYPLHSFFLLLLACRNLKFSPSCLKGDMLRVLRLLSLSPPYQILPGVTVSSSGLKTKNVTEPQNKTMDFLLAETLAEYLKSLTLHVPIYNEEVLDFIYQQNEISTGRGKKLKFFSIYTVFAIAFALLSALVGKAMTLSIVSLVIAMIARNAPGNNPANSPPPVAYDIIRRPQIQYAQTQTQEDIYEGAHSGLPLSYVYPRVTSRSSPDAFSQRRSNSEKVFAVYPVNESEITTFKPESR